jgi:hypothetical protein
MKTEGRGDILYLFPQETVKLKLRSILRWARCVVQTVYCNNICIKPITESQMGKRINPNQPRSNVISTSMKDVGPAEIVVLYYYITLELHRLD